MIKNISRACDCVACDVVPMLLQTRRNTSLLAQKLPYTLVPAVADALLPAPPLNDSAFVQWLALAELTHAAAATAANSKLLLLLPHLILYSKNKCCSTPSKGKTLLGKHWTNCSWRYCGVVVHSSCVLRMQAQRAAEGCARVYGRCMNT
jgi:hypothetical protein